MNAITTMIIRVVRPYYGAAAAAVPFPTHCPHTMTYLKLGVIVHGHDYWRGEDLIARPIA